MTQDEQSAARMADKGEELLRDAENYGRALASSDEKTAWGAVACDAAAIILRTCETARQALHDRDRFQRERDYWREECINLTGEALA